LDADCKETELDKENCGIVGYIVTFTNALAILVGIVIVIMIAVGGIQYTTARDDPQQVSAAKNRIRNAILALVFYLFTFAFLQWLVPGGVF
jgi:predicted small integral membrane protein